MRILLLVSYCLYTVGLMAQVQPPFTPAAERMKGYEQRKSLGANSVVSGIPFRNIGPTVMSGRVTDIDVSPSDPSIFYTTFASGGLWKTENNGASFTPIFDNQSVMTTGDVAVNWDKNIIWLGTGECNASRSSYAGNGIYKSMDDGKSWTHLGLEETHHIGRIILHPTDPNTVWVAAVGHLYSPNKERGIYKTTDGGKTWKQTLFVDENTGAIDLVTDPDNPNMLYAAFWDKTRRAWQFTGSGKGTGIYRSGDGGETWELLTTPTSGFPTGKGAGRIGLTIVRDGSKSALFAIIDNQNAKPKTNTDATSDELTKDKLRGMNRDMFLQTDKKVLAQFLKKYGFPEKYKADKVLEMVKSNKIQPTALLEYLEDANSDLFETDVIGAEVYRSDDMGKSWKKTHEGSIDGLFFTYGYYFAQIRAMDAQNIYVLGTRIAKSADGGKTWKSLNKENVHWDHHALWLNPKRIGHLINGNDGGVNISYDDGKNWFKCNTPSVGQFYAVNVDMAENYNVYGGLQDNGVWTAAHNSEINNDWQDSGQNPYKSLLGGDGMQVMIDNRDNNTVYTGYQFGNYYRINKTTGVSKNIQPEHDLGERPLRWNWQSPIWLSSYNQDIVYFGANKLYRSMNKGNDWTAISGDLTKGGKKGNVPYGTLTTIHESPLKFGLLYTGSDDGFVHVSKDGGVSWKNISNGLPADLWVSRIQASAHQEGTVYASLNGYRWDDFKAYLYVSENYGETWKSISANLPAEPINVVREDAKNENLLYVGTDHGLYVSLDKGLTFNKFQAGLPAVSVHDLVIHPRDNEMLVGTHGRSLYLADVAHLQTLKPEVLSKTLHPFSIVTQKQGRNWGRQSDKLAEPNEPKVKIPIFCKTEGNVTFTVRNEKFLLKRFEATVVKGLNYIDYDLTIKEDMQKNYEGYLLENTKDKDKLDKKIEVKKADNGKIYLQKGKFIVDMEKDGQKEAAELIIE